MTDSSEVVRPTVSRFIVQPAFRRILISCGAVTAVASTLWLAIDLVPGYKPMGEWRTWIAFAISFCVLLVLAIRTIRLVTGRIDADISPAQQVIVRLRSRARALRRGAGISLLLIVAALTAGLSLFYLAADISDNSLAKILDAIHAYSAANAELVQRQESSAQRALNDSSYYLSRTERGPETAAEKARADALRQRLTALATTMQGDASAAIKSIQQSGTSVEQRVLAIDHSDQTRKLISTIATRVGAVLIIVFLVQILVSMYRYNVRLASHYDARADAMQLALDSTSVVAGDLLEKFVRAMSSENIEFGAMPKSPADTAVELLKAVSSVQQQAKG